MNEQPTTPSMRTAYLADLAVGHELRAEAVRDSAVWLLRLPHWLKRQITQRLDRLTGTSGRTTDCA